MRNIFLVIPARNFGSFITTTFNTIPSFFTPLLHSHHTAAQYNNKGTLNHCKKPHRKNQCGKNSCYVCQGAHSAWSAMLSLQKKSTPFHYIVRKRVCFCYILLIFHKLAYAVKYILGSVGEILNIFLLGDSAQHQYGIHV